jgi:DNA-binding transcriptional MerR regulator|tara:strand:- start:30 stop:431 length:402 start_codon:yes stop_codon:yes gene_type:complete
MNKIDTAYKSIGEVAKILGLINQKNGNLNTHTIRFWEKEFKQIKPRILSGKRRYYDVDTIELLRKVKFLLKDQGMTINGVKKILNQNGPLKLDEFSNNSISVNNSKLKSKLYKILNIIKQLRKLKQDGKKNTR